MLNINQIISAIKTPKLPPHIKHNAKVLHNILHIMDQINLNNVLNGIKRESRFYDTLHIEIILNSIKTNKLSLNQILEKIRNGEY